MFKFSIGDIVERNDEYYEARGLPLATPSSREKFVVQDLTYIESTDVEVLGTNKGGYFAHWMRKVENV